MPTSPTRAPSNSAVSRSGCRSPTAAIKLGISTIYQELDLVDGLSVAENIFLGHEISRLGFVSQGRPTGPPARC